MLPTASLTGELASQAMALSAIPYSSKKAPASLLKTVYPISRPIPVSAQQRSFGRPACYPAPERASSFVRGRSEPFDRPACPWQLDHLGLMEAIMRRLTVVLLALLVGSGSLFVPGTADASLPFKTVVLIGGMGRELGETHWEVLRDQFAQRGFPDSDLLEFSYAGGTLAPDGSWAPNPGGECESYSKTSILRLRQMMADLAQVRPDHEV